MERGKVRGDYASAYKLSGPGSTIDRKTLRVHRRSIEQKELRQVAQNKRRPLADLSPVQEGDMSSVNKSYKDKTPVKRRDDDGKSQKRNDRLEQLMKWKQERELKKKFEAQSRNNPVFRVSKAVNRDDLNLFKKSTTVKHTVEQSKRPVKPHQPAPTKAAASKPTKPQPAAPTRGRPTQSTATRSSKPDRSTSQVRQTSATRTRQTSGNHSQPTVKKSKENVPVRSTRQTSGQSGTEKAKSAKQLPIRNTRQSARNKVPAVSTKPARSAPADKATHLPESNKINDLSKVTTSRGESFAPAEFSFNMSSFVFKPLSPGSAAGFLYPGQDNSCASFLETNPKRASTPKRDKDVRRSSRDVAKVTDKFCDTMLLENTAVNMKEMDATKLETTMVAKNEDAVEHEPATRRSTRHTSSSAAASDNTPDKSSTEVKPGNKTDEMDGTVVDVNSSSRRSARLATRRITRSSRRSVNDSGLVMEDSQMSIDATCLESKSSKQSSDESGTRRTRSRSRKSTSLTNTNEHNVKEYVETGASVESGLEDSCTRKFQEKSTDESESASEQDKNNSAESSADEVFVKTPKHSVRRSMRRSILSTKSNEEADISLNLKKFDTPKSVLKKDNKSVKKVKHVTLSLELSEEEDQGTRKSARHARRSMPSAGEVKKASKKMHRKSMLPRLPKSPEEWVDLLSNSPMIEMTRRTPKAVKPTVPALNFDDIDLEQPNFDDTDSDTPVPMETNTSAPAPLLVEPEPAVPVSTVTSPVQTEGVVPPVVSLQDEEPAVSTSEDTSVTEKPAAVPVIIIATSPKASETVQFCEVSSTQGPAEEEHDVKYFRNMISSETSRLNILCQHWDKINLDQSLTEDVHGQIRTTVGQAQLLMDQRFKQFGGLVDDCEYKRGEKETTCTDLQGFWDMIFFQVEDVDDKFKHLDKMQAKNWVVDEPVKVKKPKKKVDKPAVAKPVVKSKFAAFRAQMKKQQTAPPGSPALETKQEEKVFEIPGFFRVASPVRTPKPHCEAGTPKKATTVLTPKPNQEEPVNSSSAPGSSENLIHRFNMRKSYVPIVPSPLLQDTTPLPRPTRACTIKSPVSSAKLEGDSGESISRCSETGESASKRLKTTPARRSLRPRKFVNFGEEVSDIQAMEKPQTPQVPSDPSSDDEMNISQDSFSKYLQPANNSVTEGSRRKRRRSSLKGCKSTERRRSRRSVHFSSPASDDTKHMKMPRTPFNRDSIVKRTRITRRSVNEEDIFSIDTIDNDENTPPAPTSFRSPRPSLLYTPPKRTHSPKINPNVPTGILISFSP